MRNTRGRKSALAQGVTFSKRWLESNSMPVYDFEPRKVGPAPKPEPTKPASELRRGDEIRQGDRFVSVCDVQPQEDGRIRVCVAPNMRCIGWYAPETPFQVSPATARAFEPRRRVLSGRDKIEHILAEYFPGDGHEGARAIANNMAGWLAETPPAEMQREIEESLAAKLGGIPMPALANRIRLAWLLARGGH